MATSLMECGNYFINAFGISEGVFFLDNYKRSASLQERWLLQKLSLSVTNPVALATAFHPEDNIQEIILSLHFGPTEL